MSKPLAALLVASIWPGIAGAAGWGEAPRGMLDLAYLPYYQFTQDETQVRGDGAGFRGAFRIAGPFGALVEYDNVDLDAGGTFERYSGGLGWIHASGSGLYLEYGKQDLDGEEFDGVGGRGRLMGQLAPDIRGYLDLGFRQQEGDLVEFDELSYSIGATLAISKEWGLFADYRILDLQNLSSSLGPVADVELEAQVVRIGVSASLDY